ncbi:hypothetical protein MKX01_023901 [Papaver californicum]|nr:hypothetical protein MKX01_023901 [Papaver californicum]
MRIGSWMSFMSKMIKDTNLLTILFRDPNKSEVDASVGAVMSTLIVLPTFLINPTPAALKTPTGLQSSKIIFRTVIHATTPIHDTEAYNEQRVETADLPGGGRDRMTTNAEHRLHQLMLASRDFEGRNVKIDGGLCLIQFAHSQICTLINKLFFFLLQGVRLELCANNRVGLLSDITRIFRENGLFIVRADVATEGGKATNAFYSMRKEIEPLALEARNDSPSPTSPDRPRLSLGGLLKSHIGRLSQNFSSIK